MYSYSYVIVWCYHSRVHWIAVRKAPPRWSDNPLSAIDLGGKRHLFEAVQNGDVGSQAAIIKMQAVAKKASDAAAVRYHSLSQISSNHVLDGCANYVCQVAAAKVGSTQGASYYP